MYHRQLTNISLKNTGKTDITDWINSLDRKPSARLHRILLSFKHFEDVNRPTFLDKRNAGSASWKEFCYLANIEPKYISFYIQKILSAIVNTEVINPT